MFVVETAEQQSLLTPAASKVTQNTICLVVKKGRFGTKRKAAMQEVDVDADKQLLALSKTILESAEVKKVAQLDGELQSYLKGLCLRSMFRGGVYLIPLGLVEEFNAMLHDLSDRRKVLVEEAVATYDQRILKTSERLQVLHDPGDYPGNDRFKSRFYLEWQFVTWETPTRLRAIKPTLFEVERQKAAAKLSAVADECRLAMRAGLKELVDHMVERLQPDEEGKKKKFGKRTVENFFEFFRTFELKNVTDDTDLAVVVAKAKQVMSGVDADMLRKDDAMRAAIMQQFTQIKGELDPITVERGDITQSCGSGA